MAPPTLECLVVLWKFQTHKPGTFHNHNAYTALTNSCLLPFWILGLFYIYFLFISAPYISAFSQCYTLNIWTKCDNFLQQLYVFIKTLKHFIPVLIKMNILVVSSFHIPSIYYFFLSFLDNKCDHWIAPALICWFPWGNRQRFGNGGKSGWGIGGNKMRSHKS